MNKRIKELAEQAGYTEDYYDSDDTFVPAEFNKEKFAELLIMECIEEIETYRIPVGNSAAGEMACEWTYDALKSIRQNIWDKLGVKHE